jgi:hypothetical protein
MLWLCEEALTAQTVRHFGLGRRQRYYIDRWVRSPRVLKSVFASIARKRRQEYWGKILPKANHER